MSMATENWKARKLKKSNGSQTAGKDKGLNCRATPLEKWMASSSRSYKHPRYGDWVKIKHGCKPTRKLS